MSGNHDHGPPRPFRRLWPLIKPERADLWLIFLFAIGVGVLSLATPIAIEALVNTVINVSLQEPVIILALIMFVCLALAAAMTAMQTFVAECIQQRMFVRVVSDFAHRLPKVDLRAYDRQYGPELVNRFFDLLSLKKAIATLLVDGVGVVIATIVGLIVLSFYHSSLITFGLMLVLGMCFMFFVLGRGGVTSGLHESHAKYAMAAWLQELARVPRFFKFNGGGELARHHASEHLQEWVRARKHHFAVVYRQFLFALLLQVLASSVILGMGGLLVVEGTLTLGQLVAAELIVSLIVSSFTKMGKYLESFYDMCIGVEKLGLITDLPTEPDHGEHLPVTKQPMAIAVQNLDYEHDAQLLQSVSWKAQPGERIGLVGPSGAGKSLLFDLLAGLRQPSDGRIEIDGIDLRHLNFVHLREQVSIVQGVDILTGTISENLSLGRHDVSMFEMRQALEKVGLLSVIAELPDGLETSLIPSGRPLSTGESIRLAIARAMLTKPRLLIIDGMLDLIDFAPCPYLIDHLFDRSAPWTLLVATHRQEVMDRCDRIVRLENTP